MESISLGEAILVCINKDGTIEMYAVSLLEDLWHDYLYFKNEAERYLKKDSSLKHKRYLRAALLCLLSYLEGVVNEWGVSILTEKGASTKQIEKYVRKDSLMYKCKWLTTEAVREKAQISEPTIARIKHLRNELVHLKAESEVEIFEDLTLQVLSEAEKSITEWLDTVGQLLGKERHTNTELALDGLTESLGTVISDEYSGEGLLP